MYTLIIAVLLGLLSGAGIWHLSGSIFLTILTGAVVTLGINILVGRYFLKKLNVLMASIEKDVKSERYDMAIDKLKGAYPYSKWQFMLKQTIDSQIGSLYYIRKKFDEALPYLQNSSVRNWTALCMLAAHYYRSKEYNKAYSTMEKAITGSKKEPFVYSLYAYFLNEQGDADKAITILSKGLKRLPLNEQLASETEAVKNKKKFKIQNYGMTWMQLHLGKSQDGAKPYQAHLMSQKFRRR